MNAVRQIKQTSRQGPLTDVKVQFHQVWYIDVHFFLMQCPSNLTWTVHSLRIGASLKMMEFPVKSQGMHMYCTALQWTTLSLILSCCILYSDCYQQTDFSMCLFICIKICLCSPLCVLLITFFPPKILQTYALPQANNLSVSPQMNTHLSHFTISCWHGI